MNRRQQALRLSKLRERWSLLRERDHDMHAIGRYHRAPGTRTASSATMDDRTWADLNMDDVFAVLDRTESVVGQQVLYARLRDSPNGRHTQTFEALVTHLHDNIHTREAVQLALMPLTDPAGYDLIDLAAADALEIRAWHAVFPALASTMVATVVVFLFYPIAILAIAAGCVISLALRSTAANGLRTVTGAFRQVGPLVAAADALNQLALPGAAILATLRADVRNLARLRRIAAWAGRDGTAAASGNIAALLFEYLNLLFCLDANALFFGARELRARAETLTRVIGAVGDVDAAVSIASYRAGTKGWTRPVIGPAGTTLRLSGVRHPLLPEAVGNSVSLGPPHGAVITGSNMSGKTTFLRTVGVTTAMAQTINTCIAESYEGPTFVVRSCIGRDDDPASGRSYYMVEVESVLALVHASRTPAPHLMLFDELFRGTNAVERIAAGEAVLSALLAPDAAGRPAPHVVLAATHDQELVDLLADTYAPFHFTDTMDRDGLAFDYRLLPGPATTRNAIALLGLRGAPVELVARAMERARELDAQRGREPLYSRSTLS
ncbi:MAG: hypothetical protein ABI051_13195 [Vicinamibacterales bacterium]